MEVLFDFIRDADTIWIYVLLCISAYAENVIPPVPGDTVVIFGAYLAGTGLLAFVPIFVVTTVGSAAGFMTLYMLGRLFGKKIVETKKWKVFASDDFNRVETWFEKYGYAVIGANRFLSGARSVISLFAGIAKLRLAPVLLLSLLSCALWNFILVYAGYAIGDNWQIVTDYIRHYNQIVFTVIGVVIITVFVRYYILKKKSK
jgi:membrane protein DedA with SNARE-associated domain